MESAENAGSAAKSTRANSKTEKPTAGAEKSITTSTTKACTKEAKGAAERESGTPAEKTKVAEILPSSDI